MKRHLTVAFAMVLSSLCFNIAYAQHHIRESGDRAVADAGRTRFEGREGDEGFAGGHGYGDRGSFRGRRERERFWYYHSDEDHDNSNDSGINNTSSSGNGGSSDTGTDQGQKKKGFFGKLASKIFGEGATGTTWGWCLALGLGFGILAAMPWFFCNPPVAALCIAGGLLGGALVAVAITRF